MIISLVLIVLMLAAVIPWLVYRFFRSQPKKKAPVIFEYIREEAAKKKDNKQTDPYFNALSLIENNALLPELQHKKITHDTKYPLSVNAPIGRYFMGYELLQALQDAGLEFGEQNLFHFYDEEKIVFSVVPDSPPYCFDMEKIGVFSTKGLNFLFDKNQKEHDALVRSVAMYLAEELGGSVRDA